MHGPHDKSVEESCVASACSRWLQKTGANVALDGSEDHMIVREAGKFFQSLHVREKINREVAIVRKEVQAGRLRWTYEDVKSLIQPYPTRKGDDILNANGEH